MINPVTFFLKIGYTVLFITSLLEFITSLTLGKGIRTQMAPQVCPDMVRYIEPRVNSILDTIPPLQQGLRRLVFAHEPKRTIEYGVLFFIMHKVGKFVSLWAMCFMGVFFLFTVPFILKIFEKDIDVAVNHGWNLQREPLKNLLMKPVRSLKFTWRNWGPHFPILSVKTIILILDQRGSSL
ncbi:hypothetical protein NCAS_0C02600 [Naumovozyma castellii]|uniref:Reticulon domain-containing protein n=1 Tax=Naumovozyma castellii TaxID=27288 RepID=G0VCP0_NAUCA|nr:hypothetical protein NCAS_0C02600 [Naumovozyma castellii CBS 4309]CCC69250.1 hypothetical protein NCAS_0C02600 [Naumovozyma castellii CBS 4309]